MNFIDGELIRVDGIRALRSGGTVIPLPRVPTITGVETGRRVAMGIRPEDILVGEEAAACDQRWDARVDLRESLGSETLLWCSLAGARIAIKTSARVAARIGDSLPAGFASDRVSLFDADTEERL